MSLFNNNDQRNGSSFNTSLAPAKAGTTAIASFRIRPTRHAQTDYRSTWVITPAVAGGFATWRIIAGQQCAFGLRSAAEQWGAARLKFNTTP
jgi:hypothetical protein